MYEGQYFKDKKQGFGAFKWASGNLYIGQYNDDEREGLGKMRWTDGSSYVGEWAHGIQHGYGRMVFPDGSIKEGLFENNIYKGPGEPPTSLTDPNFDIMKLKPPELTFSDEIINFHAAIRPQEGSYEQRMLPPIKRSSSGYRNPKYSKPQIGRAHV